MALLALSVTVQHHIVTKSNQANHPIDPKLSLGHDVKVEPSTLRAEAPSAIEICESWKTDLLFTSHNVTGEGPLPDVEPAGPENHQCFERYPKLCMRMSPEQREWCAKYAAETR